MCECSTYTIPQMRVVCDEMLNICVCVCCGFVGSFLCGRMCSLAKRMRCDALLLQTRLVGGLPDLGQSDGTVETMEYAQRQSDPLDQRPGDEPVEVQLHLCGEKCGLLFMEINIYCLHFELFFYSML